MPRAGVLRWGLGRTVAVTQPNNSGNSTYTYSGNTVTVTGPAGKWKRFLTDALGNLRHVNEPNPSGGGDYVTYYSSSTLNQLLRYATRLAVN